MTELLSSLLEEAVAEVSPTTAPRAAPTTTAGAAPTTTAGAVPTTAAGIVPSTAAGTAPTTAAGAAPTTSTGAVPTTTTGAVPITTAGATPLLEPIQLPANRPVEAPTPEELQQEFELLKSLGLWSKSDELSHPVPGHPFLPPAGTDPSVFPPNGAPPHSPASPLDESLYHQLPDFTQLPGPAFTSLGDQMQFICALVQAQSEMILRLEDVGRRQNKLIHQLEDKVEVLSVKLQPRGTVEVTPQPLSTSSASNPMEAAYPDFQPADPRSLPSLLPSTPPSSSLYPALPPLAAETSSPTYADRARISALPASSASRPRRKIAMITDSIAGKVHTEYLENITKSKITKAKAYGAVRKSKAEGYKFPEKNFTAVVPAVLSTNDHTAAVLLAPSVHLTNLPTHTSDEQASEQAREVAHQMMAVAVEAVISHPNLEKLVILEAAARFDQWSEINQHGNEERHVALEAIEDTEVKNKIFIGKHDWDIDCEAGLRLSRYGDPSRGNDGIHLKGSSGRIALTRSIANILAKAGLASPAEAAEIGRSKNPSESAQSSQSSLPPQSFQQPRPRQSANPRTQHGRRAGRGRQGNRQNTEFILPIHNRFSPLGN